VYAGTRIESYCNDVVYGPRDRSRYMYAIRRAPFEARYSEYHVQGYKSTCVVDCDNRNLGKNIMWNED
jgi:hypothetical protein